MLPLLVNFSLFPELSWCPNFYPLDLTTKKTSHCSEINKKKIRRLLASRQLQYQVIQVQTPAWDRFYSHLTVIILNLNSICEILIKSCNAAHILFYLWYLVTLKPYCDEILLTSLTNEWHQIIDLYKYARRQTLFCLIWIK